MSAAVVVAMALLLSYSGTLFAAEKGKDVSVIDLKGNVEVMASGSSSWTPAVFGMKLGSGDTIRTQADSYADLNFNGMGQAALVRVDANSTMKVDTYNASMQAADRKIALDLAMGDILVKANSLKNESQFQVRTPTSVVGVRGTGFKVHVSAEQ